MNILDKIKKERITQLTKEMQEYNSEFPRPSFFDAIGKTGLALIAEFKRASPSAGTITPDLDLDALAKDYLNKGAKAFSVLTEEAHFKGSNSYLKYLAENYPQTPILRKDFIFHPFQIFQAKLLGASCVLLIVNFVEFEKIQYLHKLAQDLELDALVEVHTKDELSMALSLENLKILGINNRDLTNFTTDINNSFNLFATLPKQRDFLTISESGFKTHQDLKQAEQVGFDAVLIGETMVRGGLQ